MSDNEFVLTLIGIIGGFSTVWGLGYLIHSWIKSRALRGQSLGNAGELHEQLAHLQMSVDAMSLEIERISEAQRFTTRLLAGPQETGEHVERQR